MYKISALFTNNKQILKVSEHWSSKNVKVNIVFKSKQSFNLWQSIITDSKVFNKTELNKSGLKLEYLTKV